MNVTLYLKLEGFDDGDFDMRNDFYKSDEEFFDAMGYCLSISKGQFHKMKNENNIEEINRNYFINIKYDSELGLLLSDEESTLI